MTTVLDLTNVSAEQRQAIEAILGQQPQTIAIVQPAAQPVHPFMAKVTQYRGRGGRRPYGVNVRPLFKVNTVKGERGVYLITDDLTVYTCKLTNAGYCYAPGKYDGSFKQSAESLLPYNS